MSDIKMILFDLDGTIINSMEGITKSAAFSLESYGIKEDPKKLTYFIGPPLWDTFMKYYGFSYEQADEAVTRFRSRYETLGIHECSLYPYAKECLENLKKKGYGVGIASSKPEKTCNIILNEQGIANLFDDICGADKHGPLQNKNDIIRGFMRRNGISDPEDCILVGDTVFDVLGAKDVGMDCIGVTYGFGSLEEMKDGGALAFCDSLKEVDAYFGKKENI